MSLEAKGRDTADRSIVMGQTDWKHAGKIILKERQSQHWRTDQRGTAPAMTHNIIIIDSRSLSNPDNKTSWCYNYILCSCSFKQVMKHFLIVNIEVMSLTDSLLILIQLCHLQLLVESSLACFSVLIRYFWSTWLTSLWDCQANSIESPLQVNEGVQMTGRAHGCT